VAQVYISCGTGAHQLWHRCSSTVAQVRRSVAQLRINCGTGAHQLWHRRASTEAQVHVNFMFVIEDILEHAIKY